VTVTSATQRITAAAQAPLASLGGTATFRAGICYQVGAGALANFVGGFYSIMQADDVRSGTPASASITGLAPNTYNVGYCVMNTGTLPLNSNDYVNGWVILTN